MMTKKEPKIVICYIPGMDLQKLNMTTTPNISGLLGDYSNAQIDAVALPEIWAKDMVPEIISGVNMSNFRSYYVRLKKKYLDGPPVKNMLDFFPDLMTTTFQCFIYCLDKNFDLAIMPFRRRRRLDINRFRREAVTEDQLYELDSMNTIFKIIGPAKINYTFSDNPSTLSQLLDNVCKNDIRLEFFNLHGLDIATHWHIDNTVKINEVYGIFDNFIGTLHHNCQQRQIPIMMVSDHSLVPVKGTIDIKRILRRLNLSDKAYTCFIEVTRVTFWFHTESAREKIISALANVDHGNILDEADLCRLGFDSVNGRYMHALFIADCGYIFFPHDFYNPFANVILGLTGNRLERPRLSNPRHRAYHGYLPDCPSERGFVMLFDKKYKIVKQQVRLTDIAPSILDLFRYPKPDYMSGESFVRKV